MTGRTRRAVARAVTALVLLVVAGLVLLVGSSGQALRPTPRAGHVVLSDLAVQAADPTPDLGRLRAQLPAGVHPPAPATTAAPTPATSSAPAPSRPAPPTTRTPAPTPAPPPAEPAGRALPLPVTAGGSTQVVTVVAASSGSTTATVTAWQLRAGGWTAAVGPVTARIGRQGVGRTSEDLSRTPAGTFTLTEGFGRLGNPGTRLPYRVIDTGDYWVSDRASPLYNQFHECAGACPFSTAAGEHLWDAGYAYDYALVIDYNRHPAVPGAGSAFFLHVTDGAATAGCVAIPQSSLVAIMRWLDPGARPLIAIGVG